MKLTRKLGALLLGTALLAAAAPVETYLKAKDQAKLGAAVRDYYDAVTAKKDIAKTRSALVEAIAKQNKKLSKKTKTEFDILASGDDLAAIFAAVKKYPKRSPAGKVVNFSKDTFLGEPVEYALHAPKGYKASKSDALPLILIIPGDTDEPKKSQKDPDKELDEEWALGELRGGAVLAALQMPNDPSLWSVRGGDKLGGLETVMFALREIRQEYRIDPDKIFLAGRGAGVAAAADIANEFPFIFAGVIGRSGDLGPVSPTNFRNLPTLFAGGGSGVSTFAEAAGKLNYENVTVKPDARLEDVWAWIKQTRRDANPSAITFAPATNNGGSYWISCDGFDPDAEEKPEITAEIDRAENIITVTSKGIATIVLSFNDSLVDLDREVTVICNGVVHKDKFRRNLSMALDLFFRSNDYERVYTASKVYDLPEPAEK